MEFIDLTPVQQATLASPVRSFVPRADLQEGRHLP
jgi:hypothetical protein